MIKIFILTGLIATSVIAYGNSWKSAYNTGSYSIDWQYNQCVYEVQFTDYKFVINYKGMCPYSIQYNLETGKWKR